MNDLLLDTHALIWFAAGDTARMPASVVDLTSATDRGVFVSAASIWEIATKVRLGKMAAAADLAERPLHYLAELGMTSLPITVEHARLAGGFKHSDGNFDASTLTLDCSRRPLPTWFWNQSGVVPESGCRGSGVAASWF